MTFAAASADAAAITERDWKVDQQSVETIGAICVLRPRHNRKNSME